MKRVVAALTVGILVLSFVASLAGALSYRHQQCRTITTACGEVVEIADAGVYRYSLRALVTGGAPWDAATRSRIEVRPNARYTAASSRPGVVVDFPRASD